MAWFYIFIAGLLEVVWAVGLKYTEGFTKLFPSIGTVIGMIASFYFLSKGLKTIPLGTGYAVWTGIGAVGTTIFGILFYGESKDLLRIACIFLIVIDIFGLKVLSGEGNSG